MNDTATTTTATSEAADEARDTELDQLPSLHEPMPGQFSGSPTLQIMLNDRLFERAKLIAKYMSDAVGFIPKHLEGKTAACFAVLCRAITWKLDPYAVAQSTYQTPGGKVGYEGKLCQAILENSGRIVGPVKYEMIGDWSKVRGKFELKTGDKGTVYPQRTWDRAMAKGLGVRVSAKVKGETDARAMDFWLEQAFPLNSTLWATDPETQIKYTAVRRFASSAAPGIFMGVPFEGDYDPAASARDVTPDKPEREEEERESPAVTYECTDADGEVHHLVDPTEAYEHILRNLHSGEKERGREGLEAAWDNNSVTVGQIRETHAELADALHAHFTERSAALSRPKPEPTFTQAQAQPVESPRETSTQSGPAAQAQPAQPSKPAKAAAAPARTPPAKKRDPIITPYGFIGKERKAAWQPFTDALAGEIEAAATIKDAEAILKTYGKEWGHICENEPDMMERIQSAMKAVEERGG